MEQYIHYINEALPEKKNDRILYRFKKKILDEMNQRSIEVSSRGVNNRKVIDDLIMSEHPDLKKEYEAFYLKEKAAARTKRNALLNVIGSAIYLIALVTAYLGISFVTHQWEYTWVLITDGVLLWVCYLLSLGVVKFTKMKRIFHIFARVFLAIAVMVLTVAAFLFYIGLFDLPKGWLIIIGGLILGFLCDGIYASAAKHRLAIISWIVYIPVIATFLFIIIGALHLLAWRIAWIIIPLSLIIDLIIILLAIAKNKLEKEEVADPWSEN